MPKHQLIAEQIALFDDKFKDKGWNVIIFSSENGFGEKFEMTKRDFIRNFLSTALSEAFEAGAKYEQEK